MRVILADVWDEFHYQIWHSLIGEQLHASFSLLFDQNLYQYS